MLIQIRKTLNILLRKEVVYNKDCTLKGNSCLIITSLPYLINWRQKELYKKKKTLMKNTMTSRREQGRIIHQIEVFKVDRIATFKTFLSEKVLSCRTICLVFVLIVIYSLLYKGWVWLFVGLGVSKSCNKRWVWPFGEIDWSQSRE